MSPARHACELLTEAATVEGLDPRLRRLVLGALVEVAGVALVLELVAEGLVVPAPPG